MSRLDDHFTATLEKSPAKGGWTFLVMPARLSGSAPAGW